jgi:Peptidase M1 N-terminal domain
MLRIIGNYKLRRSFVVSVQFGGKFKSMTMWFKLLVLISALSFALAASSPRKLFKIGFDAEDVLDDGEEVSIVPLRDPFDNLDYRLPNNTKPLRYDIQLTTDIHKGNFTFVGRVTIQIEAIENSTEITMHYRELTIVNVALLGSSGETIQSNVPFTKKEDVEFLIITPTQRLTENTFYLIVIDYIGELRDDDAGFYRSSYVDISGSKKWLATTQFESTDARHAFPW